MNENMNGWMDGSISQSIKESRHELMIEWMGWDGMGWDGWMDERTE
jgi:hypothetical protein